MPIKIVDLFSGPGGLAEGFAFLDEGKAFSIAVSAEMEASAHNTLTLRAFFRLSRNASDSKAISAYYEFYWWPALPSVFSCMSSTQQRKVMIRC